jgi:NTP pyrophosphatase (non-canonical NTP hydrolase)
MDDLTLKDAQKMVDEWIKDKGGKRYFSELSNMAQLTEEVGEVARLINRVYGEQSFREDDEAKNADPKQAIADELADVLFVTICLANQMNIDLQNSLAKNFEKKTARDTKRHAKNKKLKW